MNANAASRRRLSLGLAGLTVVAACSSSPPKTSGDAGVGGAGSGGQGSPGGTSGNGTGATSNTGGNSSGVAGTGQGGSSGGAANSTGGVQGEGGGAGVDAGPIVAPQTLSPNIVVDQFGYRPASEKIAVIRSPQNGFDSGSTFTPGAKYALVDAHSSKTLLEAAPTAWKSGATDDSSGDKAWWFDFSSVTQTGDYFVLDETNNVRSDVFAIADGVYRDVLVQSVRMLFYQRDGFAKTAAFAGANWVDGAAHMSKCYLYNDGAQTLNRDIHGGWWDAGDLNKYTNWGASDVIELLHAYVDNPAAFSDDTNIPESGNAVPDMLDEAKWELDWIARMQADDGSVLSVVDEPAATNPLFQGGTPDTAPSKVTKPCKYGPPNTSAALSTAAVFAYANVVLKSVSANTAFPGYRDDLLARAKKAWAWAQANPTTYFYNADNGVASGEQEVAKDEPGRSDQMRVKRLMAALYLYEATNDTTYRDAFDADYANVNLVKAKYADAFHGEEQETLLEYTRVPGATAAVVQKITDAFATAVGSSQNLGSVKSAPDPYLAYLPNYTWGSNQVKADQGNLLYDSVTFKINAANDADAMKGAERYVHYVHGVNPLGIVYLSNMGAHGAQKSVTRFFHSWYAKGSYWDAVGVSKYSPPPGYLTGGPNPSYNWDGCCPGGCSGISCGNAAPSPPVNQPAQKSYLDFNDNWPLDSWAVTEPDDGYQAKYVRLLSKFVK